LHPGRLPESLSKITKKIHKEVSRMALPSLRTHEAGPLLPDAVPVSANGNGILQEVWKVNGPFEEAWMGPWNAENWRDSNAWRNDSTGHSYDE
jgi:hypothetical protein